MPAPQKHHSLILRLTAAQHKRLTRHKARTGTTITQQIRDAINALPYVRSITQ